MWGQYQHGRGDQATTEEWREGTDWSGDHSSAPLVARAPHPGHHRPGTLRTAGFLCICMETMLRSIRMDRWMEL